MGNLQSAMGNGQRRQRDYLSLPFLKTGLFFQIIERHSFNFSVLLREQKNPIFFQHFVRN
jgi:hypothetical protein